MYNHDGQGYRFHVSQTNKKVEISGLDKQTVARANYRTKPPNRGPGKSDGPGTFRAILKECYQDTLVGTHGGGDAGAGKGNGEGNDKGKGARGPAVAGSSSQDLPQPPPPPPPNRPPP